MLVKNLVVQLSEALLLLGIHARHVVLIVVVLIGLLSLLLLDYQFVDVAVFLLGHATLVVDVFLEGEWAIWHKLVFPV